MIEELHDQVRGHVVRGVVVAVDDTGQVQTVDVQTHDGVVRQGVEVAMPYGLVSHAGLDGATVLLMAVGGDQGDMVAMPVSWPSRRYGAAPGEVGLCDAGGNRMVLRQGGTAETRAATMARSQVAGATTELSGASHAITTPANVQVNSPGLNASGNASVATGPTLIHVDDTGTLVTVRNGVTSVVVEADDQLTDLINTPYFDNLIAEINNLDACAALQALITRAWRALQDELDSNGKRQAKLGPYKNLLPLPEPTPQAIIDWLEKAQVVFINPKISALLKLEQHAVQLLAKEAELATAVANAASRFTACVASVPTMVINTFPVPT